MSKLRSASGAQGVPRISTRGREAARRSGCSDPVGEIAGAALDAFLRVAVAVDDAVFGVFQDVIIATIRLSAAEALAAGRGSREEDPFGNDRAVARRGAGRIRRLMTRRGRP